ncbi:hypothetical protein PsYK624_161150 [Phanerochaete sordida]|uniref:Uncharacterized protein n=1 Tax=Phanerochaete sordida TaxID=48140 RepID=A0A9P3GQC7_9APHY|nr:hypothetical protein PsYK624_161150 [Phanerochaete sordida]
MEVCFSPSVISSRVSDATISCAHTFASLMHPGPNVSHQPTRFPSPHRSHRLQHPHARPHIQSALDANITTQQPQRSPTHTT